MKYVPGCGSSSAKLVVVGEAPGGEEEFQGEPFVGPSGRLVDKLLLEVGSSRSEVYLTNVVKIRPPDNNIKRLRELNRTVEEFVPQLWEEIHSINPNCILALGNTALKALTGNDGILKWRGSILKNSQSALPKVIATTHPASLLHATTEGGAKSWKDLVYIREDFRRAVEQSKFKELILPQRTLSVARNSRDLIRFLERNQNKELVSLDVETLKTIPLCIGLAFSSHEAISVPLIEADPPIPMHDLTYIWRVLIEFLGDLKDKIKICGQNMKFDEGRCKDIGITFKVHFDMMLGWHTLYPEMYKKLQFISSILTEEPYYKDEGKEFNPKKDKIDRLFLYNAKDAAVELECTNKIIDELKEFDLYNWFMDNIMPLHKLYFDIDKTGILVDKEIRRNLTKKYVDMRDLKHDQLVKLIGHEINVNSNGPKNQVATLVFGELHCPPRKDTSEDTLKALANNVVKDARTRSILHGILEERKLRKTINTYLEAELCDDGRIRTIYNIVGTETGRTSTSKRKAPIVVTPDGIALQTMTKHEDIMLGAGGADLRSMFIADKGYSFIEADGAQAEDRVVCVLARDWDAFKILNKKDFRYNKNGIKDDRHTLTTMVISGLDFDEVTDWHRQFGKKGRHAANYDVGKHELMIQLAGVGVFISEWKAGQILDKIHETSPNIRSVFHAEVIDALQNNDCTLFSPQGRRRTFYNRWGRDMWKEAFAFFGQSTVSDQVKFAMVRLSNIIRRKFLAFAGESHDSFLGLIKDETIPDLVPIIRKEMEKPINFSKCSLPRDYDLVIPCDIKIGKRWIDKSELFPDGMEKYK